MHDLPPLRRQLIEFALTWSRFLRGPDRAAAAHRDGGGRPVLVIPGFLAGDRFTQRLRDTLEAAHYRPYGWGEGQNRGPRPDLFERLERALERASPTGEKVALIGWSLGGVYARELAKRWPDQVERVITLGTPFSGNPRANRVWRLYELVAGHKVDRPPIDVTLHVKPPVPTYAIWSPIDGIVAPSATRGLPHERDAAIEVRARHIGLVWQRPALTAILDALEDRRFGPPL